MPEADNNSQAPVRIALDAMGGDHAPHEIIKGAIEYLRGTEDDTIILLVGVPERLQDELILLGFSTSDPRLHIIPASQTIGMDEHPTDAIRAKPDASLVLCANLVRRGMADATFSAGNTGAAMVAAIQILERIEGVKRPVIATLLPHERGGHVLLVDAGANVDCRPSHLAQFALLGSIYSEKVLGIKDPRVGLLANGEEDTKGDTLTREAHALLAQRKGIHFVGNVEGNHVFEGRTDVVVCDGFVGNVLLKGAEGVVRLVLYMVAADARQASDPVIRDGLLQSLVKAGQRLDYTATGGAPFLGVNGVSFIGHGRSDSKAIASGIRQTVQAFRSGYVSALRSAFAEDLRQEQAQEATVRAAAATNISANPAPSVTNPANAANTTTTGGGEASA